MTRVRWVGVGLAAALSVAASVVVVAPGSGAADAAPVVVTATGWWTLATNAPRPAGSFQVAQAASGTDQSVAAIKIKINTKISSALFVLNEASSSFRANGAGMIACKTTNTWNAGNPGLWTDVPARNCSKSIQMVRSATQQAWNADLLPLIGNSPAEVSIMFVPGAPGAGTLPIPSLETLPIALPSLPVPVVGGVPIPPPLPVDVPLPDIPKEIAFPIQLGYMVDISGVLVGALPDTGASGAVDDLAPALSSSGDTGGLLDAAGGLGGGSSLLSDAPPLAPATVAPTQAGNSEVALASSEKDGTPWGRAWGFLLLAVLVGGGSYAVRRARAALES